MKDLQKSDRVKIIIDRDRYSGRIGVIKNIEVPLTNSTKWYFVEIEKTGVTKIYLKSEIEKVYI